MEKENIDSILRNISKANDLKEITAIIDDADFLPDDHSFDHTFQGVGKEFEIKLQLLNLRALCDKGFKSLASVLIQEFFNSEDLNGDNKIYGKDFTCDENDINIPIVLKGITQDIDSSVKRLSWSQILINLKETIK